MEGTASLVEAFVNHVGVFKRSELALETPIQRGPYLVSGIG